MYFYTSLVQIKKDWPKYRCNPMFMPLSDNVNEDFVYCIQNMQTSFMSYLLEPLTYIISNLTSMTDNITTDLNFARTFISNIRTFIGSIGELIMGIFLNIIIEFQKITISIRDLVGKMIGMVATMMYIMDGASKTIQSMWNGPSGQMVRALGNCFHPDTKLKLHNGKTVKMKNINLGDILDGGSKVISVMKLIKTENDILYKLENGVKNKPIYVTCSHLILYNNKFIEVENHPESCIEKIVNCDYFSCLITNDHKIKIGNHIFHDYDDDKERDKLNVS